jgi:hypothetical protein
MVKIERSVGAVCVGFLLLATACAHASNETDEGGGVSSEGGATVLTAAALNDGPGSILGTMTGKIPNFRVQRNGGTCPEIVLRNHVSFMQIANPHVYIDGTRATDTCILDSVRSNDVERVEVYPQGFTKRPGYGTHAHGLILVFMRSGG